MRAHAITVFPTPGGATRIPWSCFFRGGDRLLLNWREGSGEVEGKTLSADPLVLEHHARASRREDLRCLLEDTAREHQLVHSELAGKEEPALWIRLHPHPLALVELRVGEACASFELLHEFRRQTLERDRELSATAHCDRCPGRKNAQDVRHAFQGALIFDKGEVFVGVRFLGPLGKILVDQLPKLRKGKPG